MTQLKDIKKENPFRVPDNYFEELSSRIDRRIKNDGQGKIVWFTQSKVIRAIAAMIILALLIGFLLTRKTSFPENGDSLNWEYVVNENSLFFEELSEQMVFEMYIAEESTDEADVEEDMTIYREAEVAPDEVIEYLIENYDLNVNEL